mmetsp:Transcript_17927/g.36122  ORF Transcript_17927/g.36122 Transcript_17927/m.36122 type:complete len:452 (+) Transcript_17927:182-1537(+)
MLMRNTTSQDPTRERGRATSMPRKLAHTLGLFVLIFCAYQLGANSSYSPGCVSTEQQTLKQKKFDKASSNQIVTSSFPTEQQTLQHKMIGDAKQVIPNTFPTQQQTLKEKLLDEASGNQIVPTMNSSEFCTYPIFQEGEPLTTSQQILHDDNHADRGVPERVAQGFWNSLFISERENFAFCLIEKNGCSQWSTLLRRIHDNNLDFRSPDYSITTRGMEAFMSSRNISKKDEAIYNFLKAPTTTAGILVRDPLARFASAYGNKCFHQGCRNPYCFARGFHNIPKGQPVTFRQAVEWFLAKDPAKVDGHWKLQAARCGIGLDGRGLREYFDFVGYMTPSTMGQDATCFMQQAGIKHYNRINATSNETFWKANKSEFFMVRGWTQRNGQSFSSEQSAEEDEKLKKLYTPELARQLMEHLRVDYEVFHMPEPSWIADATGEWADVLFPEKCQADK